MENQIALFYCNHCLVKFENEYYATRLNFVDFLAAMVDIDPDYYLVIPCKCVSSPPGNNFLKVNVPSRVIEVGYYEGDLGALIKGLSNGLKLGLLTKKCCVSHARVLLGGGAPNICLHVASVLAPRNVKFGFFIRGDKVEIVEKLYGRNWIGKFFAFIANIFTNRIKRLGQNGRAHVFVYGDGLRRQFAQLNQSVHVIAPLIDETVISSLERPNVFHEPFRLIYVGRLEKMKNVIPLIDACKKAHEIEMTFALTVVGYGSEMNFIHEKIQQENLEHVVTMTGFLTRDKILALLDEHDALCLPSFTEGVPRVVIEAFARGLPVISTPVGGLPELFPNEIKYIDGFDAESILETIIWCKEHSFEFMEMGRAGKKLCSRFLIEKNAQEVRSILRSFMKETLIRQQTQEA